MLIVESRTCILSDKRNATAKNKSCFIQAGVSSNYVEINQKFFFSQYPVLKQSQTLCSGTIKLAKTKIEI